MTDKVLPFASDFRAPDAAQWRGLVEKILKGADFEKRLVARTADGIAVKPLYTRADVLADNAAMVRGKAASIAGQGWEIRQIVAERDPVAANDVILDELAGGVQAIDLHVAAPGIVGVDANLPAIERALAGVLLDVCPVHLTAGERSPDAAAALTALWTKAGIGNDKAQGGFHYDPLGDLASTGHLPHAVDKALAIAAELIAGTRALPGVTALAANGEVWHNAGASEAQELALVLAAVVAYLRAAEAHGVGPAAALPKIAVRLAIDADEFLGIAKLRAARQLIARVGAVCSAAEAAHKVAFSASSSWRMMTKRDPWVNMLRTTAACAGAALGGADAITILPFSWAAGRPDAFARRIARNTQVVLAEESSLGRVADPAGGSWYVEQLTSELATAAWAIFQEIEAEGGLVNALTRGHVANLIEAQAAKRRADMARGKIELTGTSAFPKLGSDGATITPWPVAMPAVGTAGTRISPLVRQRLSEPFEALRDAAEQAKSPPKVFLVTLGPLAQHAARATWIRNFLAVGGIEAVGDAPLLTSIEAGQAFANSGAAIACIASSDAVYVDLAEATAGVLKQAGAKAVYLAGRPKDEAALKAAGIDSFIFAGVDMLATLTRLQGELGV